jgi:hypothetical protein
VIAGRTVQPAWHGATGLRQQKGKAVWEQRQFVGLDVSHIRPKRRFIGTPCEGWD